MLEDILEKWRRGTRGPLPQLTLLHLLNALLLVEREGPVGRRALAHALRINDGIARGLLERLAEQGIVKVTEAGAKISPAGKTRLQKALREISVKKIVQLDQTELVPGKVSVGIHLAKSYRPGLTGITQRDEAVRAGADGSITVAVKNGKLIMPPDERAVKGMSPKEDSRLQDRFNPSEGDLIIIGFAEDQQRAMAGALAAVLSLTA